MEIDPIIKKYSGIDLPGGKNLHHGDIKEYTPSALKERFNTALLFSSDSRKLYKERVLFPLETIATELGFSFLLAERDFVLHSTVLEGIRKEEQQREAKFAELANNQRLVDILSQLEGIKVGYKYLLKGGNSLILTAIDIPQEVVDARQKIDTLYRENELTPLAMDNILHISVARITKFPAKQPVLPEGEQTGISPFSLLNRRVVDLRHQISSYPLFLTVTGVGSVLKDGVIINPHSSPLIIAGTYKPD